MCRRGQVRSRGAILTWKLTDQVTLPVLDSRYIFLDSVCRDNLAPGGIFGVPLREDFESRDPT